MHRSQPLQWFTSIVTVPREVISGIGRTSHPETRLRGAAPRRPRSTRSFAAMCCVRYGGIDRRIASTSASMPTMPVVVQKRGEHRQRAAHRGCRDRRRRSWQERGAR